MWGRGGWVMCCGEEKAQKERRRSEAKGSDVNEIHVVQVSMQYVHPRNYTVLKVDGKFHYIQRKALVQSNIERIFPLKFLRLTGLPIFFHRKVEKASNSKKNLFSLGLFPVDIF